MVNPASRMSSAISFGVFCLFAPSTIAIILSKKVSPGLAVIRTTSQSDNTCVPPVTAVLSPPLSRMTGALSPVMALSFTDATPTTTSPSPGMISPASTRHNLLFQSAKGQRVLCLWSGLDSFFALGVLAGAPKRRPGPCPCLRPRIRQNWRRAP